MRSSIRLFSALVLAWVMVAPLSSSADDDPAKPEPPIRLKKKKRADPMEEPAPAKKPDEKKPDEKKPDEAKIGEKKDKGELPKLKREDEPDEPGDSGEDAKEIVARVGKNMRAAEDRLAKKDPGDATRGIQKDIIKDLDKLIDENQRQRQQQQQQGGGGGSATKRRLQEQQQQNGGQANKGGQKQKQSGKEGKGQKQKEGNGKGKNGAGKDKEGKGGKDKEGKDGQGGGNGKKDSSRMADLYKDIWGHLPETERQQMDAYSREQFMDRYKGLLKQYYSTLSEKGRGKND